MPRIVAFLINVSKVAEDQKSQGKVATLPIPGRPETRRAPHFSHLDDYSHAL